MSGRAMKSKQNLMQNMKLIDTHNIKGDLFGGVTAGIVALPLALAFGIQAFSGVNDPEAASMGAYAGLVGATLLGFFAALFGGTHSQISGPTGPMTVVTATLVSGAWTSSGGASYGITSVPSTVLVGPEGDFSVEEVKLALQHGYRSVSLGRSRLRTETAALVAVHMMQLKNAID